MSPDQISSVLGDFYRQELERDRLSRLTPVSAFRANMDARVRKEALSEAIEKVSRLAWPMRRPASSALS